MQSIRAAERPAAPDRPRGAAARPAAGSGRRRAWLLAAQLAWFALACAAERTLQEIQGALDAAGLPPWLSARALDAWVLWPPIGLAAWALGLERGTGFRPAARFLPAAAALALAAVFGLERDFLLHRFQAVAPGVLYRSAQLGSSALRSHLERDGIRTLVSLRDEPALLAREERIAREAGVDFLHLDTGDLDGASRRFLALVRDPSRRPVLVHCEYGVARTGVLAAVYRIAEEGWRNDRALAEARRFAGYGGLGLGSQKRHFILAYQPEREQARPAGGAP